MTPLRWVAAAIGGLGLVLLVLGDDTAAVYVIAAALLLSAVEERLYGDGASAVLVTALAWMLIADHEGQTILFWIAIAVMLLTAVQITYRQFGPARQTRA